MVGKYPSIDLNRNGVLIHHNTLFKSVDEKM